MTTWLTAVEYIADYRVLVTFDDGANLEVDLRDALQTDHRAIVRELLDPALFSTLALDGDTITRANGVDFAPEFLRDLASRTAA